MKKVDNQRFLFWVIVGDILFLPYFNIVVVPLSYILILVWIVNHYKEIMRDREIKVILGCMALMLISTIFGSVYNYSSEIFADNFKRLVQYYFAFGYYFFFKSYLKKNKVDLKKALWTFVGFVVILAVIFQLNMSLFVQISSMWNKGNSYNSIMIENEIWGYTNRYNFIWTDTNNIAYAITGVIMFMLIFCKTSFAEKILLFAADMFVLFCCMSSGGWIGCAVSWTLYLLYALFSGKLFNRYISRKSLVISIVIFCSMAVFISQGYLSHFLESDIVSAAMERLQNNEESRTEIWMRILRDDSIIKYILMGKGSELYINGRVRAAHSGHLYWIYAYGFVSYFIFMKKFFWLGLRNLKRYIPLISFFLCFTMNTMVGEQKLFIILILFICYLRWGNKYDEKISKFSSSSI